MYSKSINLVSRANHTLIKNETLYKILLVCLAVDFGGAFKIKYISMFFISFCLLLKLAQGDIRFTKSFLVTEFLIFIVAPILLAFYSSVIYDIPLSSSFQDIWTFSLWIIIYLVLINLDSKEQLIEPFKKIGFYCAIVVIFTYLLIFILIKTGHINLILNISDFANNYRIGFIGLKQSSDQSGYLMQPNVYFRWTMFLIPVCLLFLKDHKLKFLTVLSAIFLTSSTGLILFSLLGIVVFSLMNGVIKKNLGKWLIFVFFIIGILICLLPFINVQDMLIKLSTQSTSTDIKLGHIQSALSEIFKSTNTFLLGTGIGSQFYSMGINAYTTNIEVSHINMLRQYGFIFFALFCSYFFTVFFKLMRTDSTGKKLALGIMGFFLCAGTNPLLLSPFFILSLIISKSYIMIHRRLKNTRQI